MDLSVIPLHKFPKYTMDCCKLINDEWKRSETARLRSLESSCDTLPTSLVLLQNNKVIGHLKLTAIPTLEEAVFVESVVIDRKLRGKGLGTILMNKAEEYCREFLNKTIVFLSTKGQEKFYSKLGYIECPPVSIYGSYTPKTEVKLERTENLVTVVSGVPPPPPMPNNIIQPHAKTFMRKSL